MMGGGGAHTLRLLSTEGLHFPFSIFQFRVSSFLRRSPWFLLGRLRKADISRANEADISCANDRWPVAGCFRRLLRVFSVRPRVPWHSSTSAGSVYRFSRKREKPRWRDSTGSQLTLLG